MRSRTSESSVEGPVHGRHERALPFTAQVLEVVRADVPQHDATEALLRRVLGLEDEREMMSSGTLVPVSLFLSRSFFHLDV